MRICFMFMGRRHRSDLFRLVTGRPYGLEGISSWYHYKQDAPMELYRIFRIAVIPPKSVTICYVLHSVTFLPVIN